MRGASVGDPSSSRSPIAVPGIAQADRERVLDRFVRLEGARSRPGSGLGLSLAAAVARLHGGAVGSRTTSGPRVRLTLPAADPPGRAGAPRAGHE